MILFSTLAAWLGWEWLRQPQRRALAIAFWTSLALGFLAKGPVAWVPLGMTGWTFWKERRNQAAPGPLAWTSGITWMLLLVALWGVPAMLQTRGEFAAVGLGEHVINRSLVSMEGHGAKNFIGYLATLPFYFLTVFVSFAPWSFWLPKALRALWRNQTRETSYLFSGVVLTFAVFTLSRTKLPHYTLPAIPFLALLLAIWWKEARSSLLWRKTAVGTIAVFTLVPLFVFPLVKALSATESLLPLLDKELKAESAVALVDFREPSLVWSLRSRISGFPEFIDEAGVKEWLARPGPRICILSGEAATRIGIQANVAEAAGWNFAKGKRLTLAAVSGPR
jgi:4-amino-4-deoxy-L-arabinose transferase-like glycosyltransferase